MRHFRDSSLKLCAVVLTASLLTATSCSQADDVARTYSSDIAEAIASSTSKMKNPAPWLTSGESAVSQTDDLAKALAKPPAGLTDESRKLPVLAEQIELARTAQAVARKMDAAAVAAADIEAGLPSDARLGIVQNASVRSPGDEEVLGGIGEQILKDLVCSVALDMVAPPEAAEIEKHASEFNYMQDKSSDAIQSALKERAAGRLGAAFHWGFRWGTYGAGLVNSGNRHLASIGGQIESPDLYFTRAYIFVVRTCLAPPTR